jgi:hypothetical protein
LTVRLRASFAQSAVIAALAKIGAAVTSGDDFEQIVLEIRRLRDDISGVSHESAVLGTAPR